MTSKKKIIVCIAVIIALAIAGAVGSAVLTKFATPAQQTETKQQKKKNKNSTNAKTEKELEDSKMTPPIRTAQDMCSCGLINCPIFLPVTRRSFTALLQTLPRRTIMTCLPDSER